jgi:hypothetical protein
MGLNSPLTSLCSFSVALFLSYFFASQKGLHGPLVSGLRKMQPLMGQLYSFSSYIYIYIYIYLDPPFIIYIKNEYLSQGARGHFFCPIKEVPFDKKKKKKTFKSNHNGSPLPQGPGPISYSDHIFIIFKSRAQPRKATLIWLSGGMPCLIFSVFFFFFFFK